VRPLTRPRLPDGWSEPTVVEDVIVADGVEMRRAGLSSTNREGHEVNGAAAELETSALSRGYFELLERVATFEATRVPSASYETRTQEGEPIDFRTAEDVFPQSDESTRWRYARSNGIALHAGWRAAAVRAFWELAERDRVLRAWYGELCPERVALSRGSSLFRRTRTYEWSAYAFPEPDDGSFSRDLHVMGVFGFPTQATSPLVMGFGARPDASDAIEVAEREAAQVLAFLWGETATEGEPDPAPTPMYHLERFQRSEQHVLVRRWLDGAHLQHRRVRARQAVSSAVAFVDLTPPWLSGGLRVAKALCKTAVPLTFGDSPLGAHLPPALRVHPIA
jgi:hypothetical protein